MLNPFAAVFNPESPRQEKQIALWVVGLSMAVLALNAAGQLHVGLVGLVGLVFLFMLLGWAGCYWYAASVHFLTQVMTLECRRPQPWFVSLQGLWPLIFLGPALSAQRVWSSLGVLGTLLVLAGTVSSLLVALHRAYRMSWPQAVMCVGMTVILGSLALLGLIGWPSMLVLGAKNLSAIPSELFTFA
jgi:hypothetical protein